jgi:hypothetical protein
MVFPQNGVIGNFSDSLGTSEAMTRGASWLYNSEQLRTQKIEESENG